MGIQGLLPFLKKIHEQINVSQFSGCTVAIDAYCWLHKGAFSCAEKLALGEKTDQYVYYCMKFINYLLSKNIKPIMVFDGCHLPSKKNVEKSRREKRELNRKKAAQFLREGRRAEARECLQRSIDISPEMALELMNVCRDKGVDCIVAPYEADAQLAYLNKCGIAQVVITEDSDLLLFGCDRVIFKMDHAGNGILIEQKRLNEVMEIQSGHFTFDKFRYMCILSGCDYLASLSGIGLAKANKVFKIARQADIKQLLKKLPVYLKTNITVPQEYVDGFVAADNTFLYQLVFDPLNRKLIPLNPYPPDVNKSELSYAGEYMPPQKAFHIALGNINIYTGDKFADFDPDTFVPKYASKKKPEMLYMLSIWHKSYRIRPRGALHERQEPDRPNLKGKEVLVRAQIKRSPHKRVREAEESQDVKTNSELSSLYSDKSPAKKKARRDDVDDHLQRFLFADSPENQDNESEEDSDQQPPQLGPTRSPRFFNSLSSAHPNVKVEAGESPNKENNVKSPRNKFACKSPSKKPRFSLNSAMPDVRSRFFATSAKPETSPQTASDQQKSTTPDKGSQRLEDLGGFKPVHKNTLNFYVKNKPEETVVLNEEELSEKSVNNDKKQAKMFSFSKFDKSESERSSPSPTSAFSWSKFKFARNNSSNELSLSEGNKNVKSQFKRVVSDSNLDKFLKKKPVEMSYEDFLKREDNSAIESGNDEGVFASLEPDTSTSNNDSEMATLSGSSDDSYPYSIDSACISQTGDIDSERSIPDSQNIILNSQTKHIGQTNSQNSKLNGDEPDNENGGKGRNRDTSEEDLNSGSSQLGSNDTSSQNKAEKSYSASKNVFKSNSVYFKSSFNSKHTTCDNNEEVNEKAETLEVVSLIDSDDDSESISQNSGTPKCSVSNQTSSSKVLSKPGCRVSGLRKSSKKNNKLAVNDIKQQSLKDMLSKFAHKKSDVPKLCKHDTVTNQEFTPESLKSSLGIKSECQRKIL